MSNRAAINLASLLAVGLLLFALIAGGTWFYLASDMAFRVATPSAKVFIEVLPATSAGYGPPQTVDYAEFVRSDAVLAPIVDKHGLVSLASTPAESVENVRSHLIVNELVDGLVEIECSLTPQPLGDVILDEILKQLPDHLNSAMWPNQPNILQEQTQMRAIADAATAKVERLKEEFQQLQETTPLVMNNDGPPTLPQVIVDKKAQVAAAQEAYEVAVTELASTTLKTNGGLQFNVVERVRGAEQAHE